ncbi:TetR/AcrR family transcriptional regulator [Streptomyces sp. 205]|uniref:TetR/AcrR family transcriptional regulator n=2 Tax=Streptomyces coffeae TaxID=621382 RepID=A0ABS1NBT5_9ACTN|nr:TetR/AcrR family transcriptional regulator [Streptomyces coffeae]
MPRRRREEQILAAAVEEFGTRGYAQVSMADLAGAIGVTKPLLYQYFGSKDGLYLAALRHIGDRLTAAIAQAMDGTTTPDTPVAVLRAIFEALEGQRQGWFLLYDPTLPDTGEPAGTAHRYRGAIDRMAARGTEDLLNTRGFDDPRDAAALKHVWTGVVGSLVVWWARHPGESAQDMAERCERLFLAALGAGRAAEERRP